MGHRHSQVLAVKSSKEKDPSSSHRHNFTLQVSLDESNEVHQIVINHIQSEAHKKWPGWEPDELLDFIIQNTDLRTTKPYPQKSAQSDIDGPAKPTPTNKRTSDNKSNPAPVNHNVLSGTLRLRNLETVLADSNSPAYFLRPGQPYFIRFIIDLSDVIASDVNPLILRGVILAKQPGKPSQVIGEVLNTIELMERTVTLSVAGKDLRPGVYRLEIQITLMPRTGDIEKQPSLTSKLKGDVLEVI
jgi:hypothetical protein